MHASECQLNIRSSVPVSVLFRVTIHPSFSLQSFIGISFHKKHCPGFVHFRHFHWKLCTNLIGVVVLESTEMRVDLWHIPPGFFLRPRWGDLTPLGGLADCPDVLPCGLMFRMYGHLVSVAHWQRSRWVARFRHAVSGHSSSSAVRVRVY